VGRATCILMVSPSATLRHLLVPLVCAEARSIRITETSTMGGSVLSDTVGCLGANPLTSADNLCDVVPTSLSRGNVHLGKFVCRMCYSSKAVYSLLVVLHI
jgi:hypothetical protein